MNSYLVFGFLCFGLIHSERCVYGAVINCGHIECRPNGRIVVQCQQYVNEGVLSPEPEVLLTDGTEQREIGMVLLPWSVTGGTFP